MFKKLAFGQYTYKNSVIHKLDPRIKILSVILLSIIAFLTNSYFKIIVFTFFIFLVVLISKINIYSLIRNLRPFFLIFLFILTMYFIFSRNELYQGILAIWKFILFVIIASILTFTTTITNMVTAIEKLLKPLKIIKINPRTISLLIALTIRFLPALFLYADRINDARLSRLGNIKNPRHIKLLFLPLIERVFRSASNLSDAMLSRNYSPERKSYFNIIKLEYYDYVSLILLLVFTFFILSL